MAGPGRAHAGLSVDRPLRSADRCEPSAVVTSSVIVIALIKVRIIFREFMEVQTRSRSCCAA